MITSTTIFLLNCNSVLASSLHHCLLHPIALTFPPTSPSPLSPLSFFLSLSLPLRPFRSFTISYSLPSQ